jgi:hypothetical protein
VDLPRLYVHVLSAAPTLTLVLTPTLTRTQTLVLTPTLTRTQSLTLTLSLTLTRYIYLLHPLIISNPLVMRAAFDLLTEAHGRKT